MTQLQKTARAKAYLDKLKAGINPLTGEPCDGDSIIDNERIKNCLAYVADILGILIENSLEVSRDSLPPFTISRERLAAVELSTEPILISRFTERINAAAEPFVKRLSATAVTNWLVEHGYLCEMTYGDKKRRVASTAGNSIGITTVESAAFDGAIRKTNMYNTSAQRFILDHLAEITACKENRVGGAD